MIIGMTEIVGAVSVFSAVTTVVVWLVRLEGKQRLCEVQSANLERLIQLEVQKIELAQRDQDGSCPSCSISRIEGLATSQGSSTRYAVI